MRALLRGDGLDHAGRDHRGGEGDPLLIDWSRLVLDVALALYSRKRIARGYWRNMAAHAELEGVHVPIESARSWANGHAMPKADAAIWLYLKADEINVERHAR